MLIASMAPTAMHVLLCYFCVGDRTCQRNLSVPLRTFRERITAIAAIPKATEEGGIHIFNGKKYGVKASAFLDFDTREADVELYGVVLGGKIAGRGRLSNPHAESGSVRLDKEFERKLSRRGVSVVSAALDRKRMRVTVIARVIFLGQIRIVLHHSDRSTQESERAINP